MKRLIKFEPVNPAFAINWIMHLKCNYDCMYCPDTRHNMHGELPSLEALQETWTQLVDKSKHLGLKYKISLTGGEPTINKNLMPFIVWLRENFQDQIYQIGVCTNGSASQRYYLQLLDYLDWIGFSVHTEFTDVPVLLDKIVACTKKARAIPGKSCNLVIMEEYWAAADINNITDFCKDNGVDFTITRVDHTFPGMTRNYPIFKINNQTVEHKTNIPYTPALREEAHDKIKTHLNLTELPESQNYNTIAYFDDGTHILTYAGNIRFLNLSDFQGWSCYTGILKVTLMQNGNVYNGDCRHELLGNLRNGTFQLRDTPIICKRNICSPNPDDLMTLKYRD